MLVKTKKVYYCEYCNRHRLTPQSIRDHEKGCTMNPNRTCGMDCENGLNIPDYVAELKARFEIVEECEWNGFRDVRTERVVWHGEPITIDEILTKTDGCPACTLAVIRQAGLNHWELGLKWDYQQAKKEWWAERNAERMVEEAWEY